MKFIDDLLKIPIYDQTPGERFFIGCIAVLGVWVIPVALMCAVQWFRG